MQRSLIQALLGAMAVSLLCLLTLPAFFDTPIFAQHQRTQVQVTLALAALVGAVTGIALNRPLPRVVTTGGIVFALLAALPVFPNPKGFIPFGDLYLVPFGGIYFYPSMLTLYLFPVHLSVTAVITYTICLIQRRFGEQHFSEDSSEIRDAQLEDRSINPSSQ